MTFDLVEAARSTTNGYTYRAATGRVGIKGTVAEYHRRVVAGDPAALADYPAAVDGYLRHLTRHGYRTDNLLEQDDACAWPAELTGPPGHVLDVPADAPILGWRMWTLRGTRLCAPLLSDEWELDPKTNPGVAWLPGVNTASTRWCAAVDSTRREAHPLPGCMCGIRAVRSPRVLEIVHDLEMRTRARRGSSPAALAQVAVWGKVAGSAADDSFWGYTLRAQHARIVGPLRLSAEHEPTRRGIERRYRLEPMGAPA